MRVGLELETNGRVVMWRSLEGALMTIGRNPECHLCLPQEEVADVHCVLQCFEICGYLRLMHT